MSRTPGPDLVIWLYASIHGICARAGRAGFEPVNGYLNTLPLPIIVFRHKKYRLDTRLLKNPKTIVCAL